jgi:hypothetical protein
MSDPKAEQFPPPILEIVVGSTLHGTAVQDGLEDLDLMAIVVERPRQFVGFGPVDTWVHRTKPVGVRSEAGDVDLAVYGLRKYLGLALKGNPAILLALFAPESFIRRHDVRGRQLQALAPYIVSKQAYQPFRGYMKQQHERLLGLRGQRNVTRPELVERYGYHPSRSPRRGIAAHREDDAAHAGGAATTRAEGQDGRLHASRGIGTNHRRREPLDGRFREIDAAAVA